MNPLLWWTITTVFCEDIEQFRRSTHFDNTSKLNPCFCSVMWFLSWEWRVQWKEGWNFGQFADLKQTLSELQQGWVFAYWRRTSRYLQWDKCAPFVLTWFPGVKNHWLCSISCIIILLSERILWCLLFIRIVEWWIRMFHEDDLLRGENIRKSTVWVTSIRSFTEKYNEKNGSSSKLEE
jgi:hypothetical protein